MSDYEHFLTSVSSCLEVVVILQVREFGVLNEERLDK